MAEQTGEDNELGLKLFKRAEKLREYRRSVFDPMWQYISDYFWPDVSDINTEKTEGTTNWFDRLYSSRAMRASTTCSIGVRNYTTPSTQPWLGLAPPEEVVNRAQESGGASASARMSRIANPQAPSVDDNGLDEAKRWCARVSTHVLQELSSGKFYSTVQTFNRSACVFGTSLMFMGEGRKNLYNFQQFKVGTYVIAENDEGDVDTVIRWFKLTVRQAVQKFCKRDGKTGKYDLSKMPKQIAEKFGAKKYDEKFEFMHHVFPREDFKVGGLGDEGKAFSSVYQSVLEKRIVQEGGYEEMPYLCVRWSRWGSEDCPYGCSPAFESLMEARQLNFVTQFRDALCELKAFPRLLIPDNLDGNVQLAAGGVTTYKVSEGELGLPREWATVGEVEATSEMIEEKGQMLDKAFFVDVFLSLSALGDKITQSTYGAIALLQAERADQFTGTFDQYRVEFINPLVLRGMGISGRANKLPKPPDAMLDKPEGSDRNSPAEIVTPKILITSRVTDALNELKNVGTEKTIQVLAPVAEAHPEVWDNFDLDSLTRTTGRNFGMPEGALRPLKAVSEMRAARAKMMAQQNALHNAEIAATAAGKLGKAPKKFQDAAGGALDAASAAGGQNGGQGQ